MHVPNLWTALLYLCAVKSVSAPLKWRMRYERLAAEGMSSPNFPKWLWPHPTFCPACNWGATVSHIFLEWSNKGRQRRGHHVLSWGSWEMHTNIWSWILKERGHLRNLAEGESLIWKLTLNKLDLMGWNDFSWLRTGRDQWRVPVNSSVDFRVACNVELLTTSYCSCSLLGYCVHVCHYVSMLQSWQFLFIERYFRKLNRSQHCLKYTSVSI
jgi:hypothetical protein